MLICEKVRKLEDNKKRIRKLPRNLLKQVNELEVIDDKKDGLDIGKKRKRLI